MSTRALRDQIRAMRRRIPAPDGYFSKEEWIEMRQVITQALLPYPEARIALGEALMKKSQEKARS